MDPKRGHHELCVLATVIPLILDVLTCHIGLYFLVCKISLSQLAKGPQKMHLILKLHEAQWTFTGNLQLGLFLV